MPVRSPLVCVTGTNTRAPISALFKAAADHNPARSKPPPFDLFSKKENHLDVIFPPFLVLLTDRPKF